MLPFFWKATVYYIPSDKICWISKLARIVNIFARRLQNQERLTKQIADAIEEYLHPKAIAVILEGKHFCMIARWVEKQNSIMKTSDLRWAFREDWKARQELFNLINK
jgi:GTP cyclohydrolase I